MSGALSEVGYPPDETRGAAGRDLYEQAAALLGVTVQYARALAESDDLYEKVAARFGVAARYVRDLACQGRLAELGTGATGGAYTARAAASGDVDEQIYQRARRLEQTYQCMPEADRRRADIEVRKRRVLRAAARGEDW